jgi:sigma-B regulation protein RsbU (phosphoserine phosphatase)
VSKDQKFLEWKMHHNETFGTHEGGFSASPPPLPPLPLFIEGEPNLANVPAYVASTGKAINIPNIYESEEFDFSGPRQYDSKTGYRAESMLGVPMLDHNDNAIGVLQLVNAKNPEKGKVIPFSSDQENLVKALASQAAVAINNALLIQNLEDTHQKLQEAQAKLIEELEKELQIAHTLQMGLMPKSSPQIEGLDIAGRCIPATHVGGDFFQYFNQDERLTLTMVDVTGHAMEAAIPVVMFSGILDSQMEIGGSVKDLFGRLNRASYRNLEKRVFVCCALGEVELTTRLMRLSNGGCPLPYHFSAESGEVIELGEGAYPLGIRPDTDYGVVEKQLKPGDLIVFCTDGLIETENISGTVFGFNGIEETIRQACIENLSAEATIDQIFEKVNSFRGNAPQQDDMTCVIVKVSNQAK